MYWIEMKTNEQFYQRETKRDNEKYIEKKRQVDNPCIKTQHLRS